MALPAGTYPAGDLTVTITDNFGRVFEQVVSSELVIRPGEMRTFPTLSFTFCYGKSNCIVVKKGETISFDAAPYYTFSKSLSVDSLKPVMMVKVENGEDVGEGEEAVEAVDAGDAVKTLVPFCEEGTTLERVWGIRNNYAKPTVTSILPDGNFTKDGNKITTTVFSPICTFRINQNRNVMSITLCNHPLTEIIGTYAFCIIRNNNTIKTSFQ